MGDQKQEDSFKAQVLRSLHEGQADTPKVTAEQSTGAENITTTEESVGSRLSLKKQTKLKSQRDIRLDILRTLAIFMIILAHIQPPNRLYQLRTFDVPLMVVVMAMSYRITQGSSQKLFSFRYLAKRFNRLVVPTLYFLIAFFIFVYVVGLVTGVGFPYDGKTIALSVTMISGIGYVWIIRVFMLIALTLPLIAKLAQTKPIKNPNSLMIISFVYLAFITVMGQLFSGTLSELNDYLRLFLFEILGYPFIALIGYVVYGLKTSGKLKLFALFLFSYLLSATLINHSFSIQAFKYPAQAQYLAYGIAASIGVFLLSDLLQKLFMLFPLRTIIQWVSKNSMTIYYIHVFILYLIQINLWELQLASWWVKYLVVCGVTLILTLLKVGATQTVKKIFSR